MEMTEWLTVGKKQLEDRLLAGWEDKQEDKLLAEKKRRLLLQVENKKGKETLERERKEWLERIKAEKEDKHEMERRERTPYTCEERRDAKSSQDKKKRAVGSKD